MVMEKLDDLLVNIRQCQLCAAALPLPPKPILQASSGARILIAGQAPGRKTHDKGIPFDDASGDRLRAWLGVSREQFYDPQVFAIIPMGFCFPGDKLATSGKNKGKKTGDNPPRRECAAHWHQALLAQLPNIELTLILGQYAIDYYINSSTGEKLTVSDAVAYWQQLLPSRLALPHPSPRNYRWLTQHPEFEREVVPALQTRIAQLMMR